MEKELIDVTKKSGLVFAGNVGHNLINMLSTILFARLLGAEIYGNFVYLFMILELISIFTQFGFSNSLVANIPKHIAFGENNKAKRIIKFSLCFSGGMCLAVIAVLIVFNNGISRFILNKPALSSLFLIMSPFLIILSFNHIFHGIFRGLNRIKYFILGSKILLPILRLTIFVVLYAFRLKILSLIFATLFSNVFITLFYFFIIFVKERVIFNEQINEVKSSSIPEKTDYIEGKGGTLFYSQNNEQLSGSRNLFSLQKKSLFLGFFIFSLPLFLNGFVNYIISHTDIYMIGYMMDSKDVGVYRVALRVGYISSFVLTVFNTMFAPMIATLFHKGEIKKVESLYKAITRWIVALNLCAFALIFLLHDEMMMVFGEEFLAGSRALILIAIGQVVNSAVGAAGYINIVSGYPHYSLYVNGIMAVVNIGLNFILIPRYGINGAAIASLISVAVSNGLRLFFVFKNHRIHPFSKSYIRIFANIIVTAGTAFCFKAIVHLSWILEFIFPALLFLIIFTLIFRYFCITSDDLIIVDAIRKRIKKLTRR